MLSAAQGLGTEEASRNTAAAFIEARYRHTVPLSVRTYCTHRRVICTDTLTLLQYCTYVLYMLRTLYMCAINTHTLVLLQYCTYACVHRAHSLVHIHLQCYTYCM